MLDEGRGTTLIQIKNNSRTMAGSQREQQYTLPVPWAGNRTVSMSNPFSSK